ncbi:hypothetical protein CAP48_00065 [Advenella sp. S44]|uniref:FUSC family protein n=1 Tax=Advenella sp. S44 TaxID=1982755 RepID=UPI000C29FF6D|nr:FUSC family protein [Advenella sp. S44]PJX27632.1 hypothetical protein CAP48_00065 [Advenella sp. S44]
MTNNMLPLRLAQVIGLDKPGVVYGLQLALSAWLAFAVASFLHIPNPFWAAMPVFVVAQATRGLAFERGLYRFVGTALGALAGFGMIHFIQDAPYAALLMLALWVAVFGALTHLLYGVQSYAMLMAGITAVVVVIPCLFAPENYMQLALARVECTFIGVIMITLSSALFTPNADRDRFYLSVCEVAASACHLLGTTLKGTTKDGAAQEAEILDKISRLEASGIAIMAGSPIAAKQKRVINAVIVSTIGLLATSRRLHTRNRPGKPLAPELGDHLLMLSTLTKDNAPQVLRPEPVQQMLALAQATDPTLAQHMQRLLKGAKQLLASDQEAARFVLGTDTPMLAPATHWGLARQTGLLCGLITLVSASLAYAGGSFIGEMTALATAMFSLVLGSMIKPQIVAPFLLKGIIAGSVIAVGYRLVIFPHIHSTELVVISLLPFLLIGGVARASKMFGFPALDATMAFLLGSQAMLPARVVTPLQVMAESGSMILAACIVAGGFILLPRRSDRHVHEATRTINKDLFRLINHSGKLGEQRWMARSVRQTLRLTAHLAQSGQRHSLAPAHIVSALNFGHSIAQLHSLRDTWTPHTRDILQDLDAQLNTFTEEPNTLAATLMQYARDVQQPAVADALWSASEALITGRDFFSYRPGIRRSQA